MKKILLSMVFAGAFFMLAPSAFATKVYYVKYKGRADVVAVKVKSRSRANCVVYMTKVGVRARKKDNGIWFKTRSKGRAHVKIFWTKVKVRAKLKVFFTRYRNRASKRCKHLR